MDKILFLEKINSIQIQFEEVTEHEAVVKIKHANYILNSCLA